MTRIHLRSRVQSHEILSSREFSIGQCSVLWYTPAWRKFFKTSFIYVSPVSRTLSLFRIFCGLQIKPLLSPWELFLRLVSEYISIQNSFFALYNRIFLLYCALIDLICPKCCCTIHQHFQLRAMCYTIWQLFNTYVKRMNMYSDILFHRLVVPRGCSILHERHWCPDRYQSAICLIRVEHWENREWMFAHWRCELICLSSWVASLDQYLIVLSSTKMQSTATSWMH